VVYTVAMATQIAHLLLAATLLVLNKEDGTLAIVEPQSGKVTGTVPTGEGPHELAVSKDGRYAYVANYGTGGKPGSSLSVIDLRAKTENRVDLSPLQRPHGITVAPDGNVYFTAEGSKAVGRLDPASKKVDAQYPTGQVGTHMVLFTPDGSRMITANIGSDCISIMKHGSEPVHVETGKGPEGFDLSPDGREVWVANSRGGSITVVDLNAGQVTDTIDIGTKRSNRLKFTPDGKFVLVSDMEAGQLLIIDVPGKKVARRIDIGRGPEGILIPPDGSQAFIAISGDNQIAVVDLKSFNITRRFVTGGRGPDGMAWVR
jgi:YVTN family beta-propeller protein